MLSDNATTFVNAANFLEDIKDDPQINQHLTSINCEWKFIPARAPWFGAIWERLIGILKVGLRKILGKALVTFDELHTILVELEATINDRPLTYSSSEFNELDPITPSHLLKGRRLKTFPNTQTDYLSDPPFNTTSNLRERVGYIDKLLNDLWKRWTSEYLLALREGHKCLLARKGTSWPRVGDIVLIHDDGPRSKWKLGQITGLQSGRDGLIRVANLRVASGNTTRPVVRLYPLEQALDDQSNTADPVTTQGTACHQRPLRQAALRSAESWQSKIQAGQL